MSDQDRGLDVVIAFGVGLIAGAATALLLAPASGSETRRRLSDTARHTGEKLRERGREAEGKVRERGEEVVGFVKDKAGRLGSAVQEGKEAFKKELGR